mmetsp:Transcript_44776/g.62741  ORF Transcript_44776/g.62741 Transcript_44776/m.62741 type:complete len:652 (+) Transcript_44776:124-2079(+)|eukprot:CAMPEP_0201478518 /NCGR_PEP_ID=MMETSP0151_2-20130828/3325_1 /ASSEMBLY_ACC=CAM_ASM_000257 /TAXON_ID=200890 /ORGANISM="Paramoeba atlantica, Strain 621/1 / CCAP 1560/9" /LENGTH=651 /DNA_ID=CAMNT_0047859613 /DNA_START=120 /DNA_END=2075 /DNA_ORIENTATION=+
MPRRKQSSKVSGASCNLSSNTSTSASSSTSAAASASSSSSSSSSSDVGETYVWASQARYNEGESFSAGKDVNLRQVSISTGGKDLLIEADLKLNLNEHYGLVGRNGIGKTTLLKVIASGLIPCWPQGLRTFLVEQEMVGSDSLPLQVVLESDPLKKKFKEEEEWILDLLEDPLTSEEESDQLNERLQELYEYQAELDQIGPAGTEARALEVLKELGFTKRMMEKPLSAMSGGWRMRVSLACALFFEPDLLLLDEPTNHLDLRAILWLQDFLTKYEGTFVVVSHDRMFLNAVCGEIIHFHKHRLTYFPGNYEAFQSARQDIIKKTGRLQELLDKKRQNYLKTIQNIERAAARNKKNEKMSGMAASRKKKYLRVGLEKTVDGKKWNCQTHGCRLGSINANGGGWKGRNRTAASVAEQPDPPVTFHFFSPPVASGMDARTPVIQFRKVSFSYGRGKEEKKLFENVDFSVYPTSKICILGPNGSGKSTFLNILAGKLKPRRGEAVISPGIRVGYFCQHTAENLDLSKSPIEYLAEKYPQTKIQDLRGYLGRFGVGSDIALRKMADLSGGQKSRVELACVTFAEPQVLVLDEPTNHLDLDTIDALIDALGEYKGAIIFVTHNQHMLLSFATNECYELRRGTFSRVESSVEAKLHTL